MKKFQKKSVLTLMLSMGVVLAACGNQTSSDSNGGNFPSQQAQSQDNSHSDKAASTDLKQFSKDSDKNDPSEGDFDVIGKFVRENDGKLTLDVKGDQVAIKEKTSFDKDMKGFKGDLKGKMVDVEISTESEKAESLKPTREVRADKDCAFKKEDDGKKLVGKLVADKKNDITVHVKNGDKTYRKSGDFEMDEDAKKENCKGKIVQLDIDKHGKVEKLKYSWADQAQ